MPHSRVRVPHPAAVRGGALGPLPPVAGQRPHSRQVLCLPRTHHTADAWQGPARPMKVLKSRDIPVVGSVTNRARTEAAPGSRTARIDPSHLPSARSGRPRLSGRGVSSTDSFPLRVVVPSHHIKQSSGPDGDFGQFGLHDTLLSGAGRRNPCVPFGPKTSISERLRAFC